MVKKVEEIYDEYGVWLYYKFRYLATTNSYLQNYGEYPLKYMRSVETQDICYDDFGDNILSTSEYLNQVLDTEIIAQNKIIDKPIQISDNKEVQDLFELLSKEFKTQFIIESVTEIVSVEEGKVSIAFNTNLCNITPNEIGKINNRAFAIFKTQNYKTINAVMVLWGMIMILMMILQMI